MTEFDSLSGQRVLLIAPAFFGYETEIQSELERRGAVVDRLLDRPFSTAIMKALARFSRALVMPAADRYFHSALDTLSGQYDLALVISGQTLSTGVVRRIRKDSPGIRMHLYMWDSLGNRPAARKKFPLFDRVLSFDRHDADAHGLDFRPLFYGAGFVDTSNTLAAITYSFIGTAHTDRYAVMTAIKKQAPTQATSFIYYFLHAPWVFHVQKIINPAFREARFSDFSFEPLPKSRVWSIFQSSRIIVDIEHPRQTGLTMRTIEAFGAGKKLITTNPDIQTYDLFDAHNVLVIDRTDPQIPDDFFLTPANPANPDLKHKYSIAGWLDDVLRRPTLPRPDTSGVI
jgi:hypothetical protein